MEEAATAPKIKPQLSITEARLQKLAEEEAAQLATTKAGATALKPYEQFTLNDVIEIVYDGKKVTGRIVREENGIMHFERIDDFVTQGSGLRRGVGALPLQQGWGSGQGC